MKEASALASRMLRQLRDRLASGLAQAAPANRQAVLKELLGWEIASRAQSGQTIGMGSGTTSAAAIRALRQRALEEGLRVTGVCTSSDLADFAAFDGAISVPVSPKQILAGIEPPHIDWGFDGADEVDPRGRLIKGGGGAHRLERIVADRAKYWVVVVDESKLVPELGAFPVPVEIIPSEAKNIAKIFITRYGAAAVTVRLREGVEVRTDSGNYILDVAMPPGSILDSYSDEWSALPGVVAHGLFFGYGHEILIARADGSIESRSGMAKQNKA